MKLRTTVEVPNDGEMVTAYNADLSECRTGMFRDSYGPKVALVVDWRGDDWPYADFTFWFPHSSLELPIPF